MTALALNPGTDRAAWLEARRACLCATDVAAILGLNPYKSPLSVWLEKTGQAEVEEVTAAMKRGTRMERYVAEQYVEETGYGVTPSQLYRHPRFEQFGATPDYEVEDAPDMRLLECKTAKWMAARDFGPALHRAVPVADVRDWRGAR
jgi:putative phage-type endonuclease